MRAMMTGLAAPVEVGNLEAGLGAWTGRRVLPPQLLDSPGVRQPLGSSS